MTRKNELLTDLITHVAQNPATLAFMKAGFDFSHSMLSEIESLAQDYQAYHKECSNQMSQGFISVATSIDKEREYEKNLNKKFKNQDTIPNEEIKKVLAYNELYYQMTSAHMVGGEWTPEGELEKMLKHDFTPVNIMVLYLYSDLGLGGFLPILIERGYAVHDEVLLSQKTCELKESLAHYSSSNQKFWNYLVNIQQTSWSATLRKATLDKMLPVKQVEEKLKKI